MNQSTLPPFHITKTTKLSVDVDHTLSLDLKAFADFYSHTHGAKVGEAELLREMARHYMANDTKFQSFRQKPRRRRRAQPSPPETETSP